MSRAIWFVAGAGAGVWSMVKARRAAEAFTPDGLTDRLAGLSVGLHLFGEEVRTGATEKEAEVRQRLGLVPPGGGRPELTMHTTTHPTAENREGND